VKRTAVQVAVVGLLVLAAVGTARGVPPAACSLRALAGAVVLYLLTRVAGWVLASVGADILQRGASSRRRE